MSWNYRILVKRDDSNNPHYGIHEVYYDDNDLPHTCTEVPCDPYGETVEELKDNMIQMMEALLTPTLEYDDIGELPEAWQPLDYESTRAESTGRWDGRGPQGIRGPVDESVPKAKWGFYPPGWESREEERYANKEAEEVENLFENLRYDSKKVRDVVNDLYRTSYLDHYAKKKILEAMEEWDGCL